MSNTRPPLPDGYALLLAEVKERVRSAQYAALRAVNKELVGLYWDIGRMIVRRQEGKSWGKAVVERLAADLQADFPGVGGFSASNLWRMKSFFEAYVSSEKLAPLVREIAWSHNLLILERCTDALEREFYVRMTRKFGWTKQVLIHQIENQSYEKTLLGQTNFDKALTPALRAQAKLAVKDEYTFDFLELGEEHSERELERALIARIETFLRAMGGRFAFIGSQYRLEVEKLWFDAGADYLEVQFREAPGFMRPTAHDAVMERVDEQGHVLGFSVLGVSRFRRDHPLEAELNAKEDC